jgi:hypothetical protein
MAAGPPTPDMQDCILGRCGSRVYNLNEYLVLRDSLGQDGLGLSLEFLHAFHIPLVPPPQKRRSPPLGFNGPIRQRLAASRLAPALSRLRIVPTEITFLFLPGTKPELFANISDAGHGAVRLDGAEDLPTLRIDLMHLGVAMLLNPDPQGHHPVLVPGTCCGQWVHSNPDTLVTPSGTLMANISTSR